MSFSELLRFKVAQIPDFDFFRLLAPFSGISVLPEIEVEVTAFDAATDVFTVTPAVTRNIKFCSRWKDLRVNSDGAGPGHARAGGLPDDFQFSFLRNRETDPVEFPAAAFHAGAVAGGFNGDNRIGTAQRRRNKVTARQHKQREEARRPENDPPFHAGTLIGNDRYTKKDSLAEMQRTQRRIK